MMRWSCLPVVFLTWFQVIACTAIGTPVMAEQSHHPANQSIFFQVSVIVTKSAVLCSLRFSQGNELGKTAVMDTTLLVPVQEEKEVRIFFSLQ